MQNILTWSGHSLYMSEVKMYFVLLGLYICWILIQSLRIWVNLEKFQIDLGEPLLGIGQFKYQSLVLQLLLIISGLNVG
jgi:hypothetical protein